MFAKFVSATFGEETGAEAESEDAPADANPQGEEKSSDSVQTKDSAGASFSLWGVAASLADTVKKNTAEITTGLKETNWRAELEAFSKGVREEEHQLRKETVKRVEVAKEHLPKDATAQLDLKRKELTAHLQKMGVGLGGLGKTLVTRTTDLFDQVRDTVLEELLANDSGKAKTNRQGSCPMSKGKYSRLDADISSMQRDSATYCDEPADTAHYQAWRSNFDLASYKPAVDQLIIDNAFMAELQARIVPVIVEYDAFWTRYFYRLHLLETRHTQRLEVAQRASRPQQEEELGWDEPDANAAADHPQPQQPSAPESPVDKPKQQPQAAPPLMAPSPTQGSAGLAVEAGAVAPSMQAVPEDHEVTRGRDSTQAQGPTEGRPEGKDRRADTQTEGGHKPAVAAGDEDAAETVTSSDSGSGNEHWTVVKSPSKQSSAERISAMSKTASSTGSPSNTAADAGMADQRKPAALLSAGASSKCVGVPADDSSEIDELDDVSNDGDLDAGNGAEEDWGSWE